ncbi:MAG: hypothetical protein KU37_03345 [Sulfuricurvum sp. PC08-66]|nr:MAG: hypothetical protein KU37_03345 [Sulfuricurvum sp. PC08-66]
MTVVPEQSSLVAHLTRRKTLTFKAHTTPFDAMDTQKYFYFIAQGRIKISQIHLQNAKEQTLSILSRGDMYDVITLLDDQAHETIALTLEPTTLIQVPIEDVRALIQKSPEFGAYFFPYLAKQLRGMEDLAVDLSLYDVYERTLRLLERHVDTHDGTLYPIGDLSHEELAALLGTVRKVLNRDLQRLKAEGIVELGRKNLRVKDIEKLFEKIDLLES